jgi:non-ribosomal peptide synthetase component F
MRAAVALVLLLVLLGAAGCARYYWSRSGGDAAQFERDSRECARASAETPTAAAYGIVDAPRYRACLSGKGWMREKQFEPVPAGCFRGVE